MNRWGAIGGSLVTAAFFTGIHVPLAFDNASGAPQLASNVLLIAAVAVGVRLLIGRVDVWTGGSLLTVGVLHSSFNATETLLTPAFDWIRLATTVAVAVLLVAFRRDKKAVPADRLSG